MSASPCPTPARLRRAHRQVPAEEGWREHHAEAAGGVATPTAPKPLPCRGQGTALTRGTRRLIRAPPMLTSQLRCIGKAFGGAKVIKNDRDSTAIATGPEPIRP
jgi:hypothetical protein